MCDANPPSLLRSNSAIELNAMPVNRLNGVTDLQRRRLAKLGLHSVQDLLLHLPLRYEDHTLLSAICDLYPGLRTRVQGKILSTNVTLKGRRGLLCQIDDGTGTLILRFFNFNVGIRNSLSPGVYITAYAEIRGGKQGFEMIHPEYQIRKAVDDTQDADKKTQILTPIYTTTQGLQQKKLRQFTEQALALMEINPFKELLPHTLCKQLISFSEALRTLHRPPMTTPVGELEQKKHPAQNRLILEELLAHHLSMLRLRSGIQRHQAIPIPKKPILAEQFLGNLPFKPTNAQKRVVEEIKKDLEKNYPMMRLVQGDVGSGKTLVAALVALNVIAQGKQVALMAPTELLAEQHTANFVRWFTPLGIEVGSLTGKQKGKTRLNQQEAIANGKIAFIVGTHAIFQESVKFHDLVLVIIDEQHRFGVHQRLALWEKGVVDTYCPHQLIMTATPIPRTLAMTLYADLDISIIDEMPPGRLPITTVVIADTRRDDVIQRVKNACLREKRQAYWICTRVKEAEMPEAQTAETTYKALIQALPELSIGLVHGQMKPQEKQSVMDNFRQGKHQLLVATTVIEVGVDVPNASVMIIENPERLGLAQLHQLRGRIGRGHKASHCVLMYGSPLSKNAQKRLQILRNHHDGFLIAQYDLEVRGPGDLLGFRQTGGATFKVADLMRDQALIPEVQRLAQSIHRHYPELAVALIERWLPASQQYTQV